MIMVSSRWLAVGSEALCAESTDEASWPQMDDGTDIFLGQTGCSQLRAVMNI